MRQETDTFVVAVLGLSNEDVMKLRDFESTWDARNEKFIPSTQPLTKLLRSVIEIMVPLDKPRKQTAKKRKPQD
jgi:hypothetical protein